MRQRYAAICIAKMYNQEIAKVEAENKSPLERIRSIVDEWLRGVPLLSALKEGEVRPWTVTHCFFLHMGGFMLCENGRSTQTLLYPQVLGKGAHGLKELIERRVTDAPMMTEAEIKDRSKGNVISKSVVVVLQTTWFVVQIIARWSANLAVTELEVVTLGFAVLNGINYFLWWEKLQDVGVPVYLETKRKGIDMKAMIDLTTKERKDTDVADSELDENDAAVDSGQDAVLLGTETPDIDAPLADVTVRSSDAGDQTREEVILDGKSPPIAVQDLTAGGDGPPRPYKGHYLSRKLEMTGESTLFSFSG